MDNTEPRNAETATCQECCTVYDLRLFSACPCTTGELRFTGEFGGSVYVGYGLPQEETK